MNMQLGYTPTADDAFMLYGLLKGRVDTGGWQIEAVESNLPTLNDHASRGELAITMISAAAYPLVCQHYALLCSGSSFGMGAGPVIVARSSMESTDINDMTVAIPGATTTAYAMLQLYNPSLRTRILPFDKLLPAVEAGLVDCALVIHEEFVAYSQYGLKVLADLGQWWAQTYRQPMPVTCCAVQKTLSVDARHQVARMLSESVRYSLENFDEAFEFAAHYALGVESQIVQKFVRQYVNDLSVDMGPQGRQALETFYEKTHQTHILPIALPMEIVDLLPI